MFTTGRSHHGNMGWALSMQLAAQVHSLQLERSGNHGRAWQHRLCTEPCGVQTHSLQRDTCDKPTSLLHPAGWTLSLHHAVQVYGLEPENWDKSALSIVVVGASGDLAKKKIYPALFALYVEVGVVMCSELYWPALYIGAKPALVALWHAWCEEVGASS